MSSDNHDLFPFLSPNGTTSYQGQVNAGTWQATVGQQSSGQQSFETHEAYVARQAAYDYAKKSSS